MKATAFVALIEIGAVMQNGINQYATNNSTLIGGALLIAALLWGSMSHFTSRAKARTCTSLHRSLINLLVIPLGTSGIITIVVGLDGAGLALQNTAIIFVVVFLAMLICPIYDGPE